MGGKQGWEVLKTRGSNATERMKIQKRVNTWTIQKRWRVPGERREHDEKIRCDIKTIEIRETSARRRAGTRKNEKGEGARRKSLAIGSGEPQSHTMTAHWGKDPKPEDAARPRQGRKRNSHTYSDSPVKEPNDWEKNTTKSALTHSNDTLKRLKNMMRWIEQGTRKQTRVNGGKVRNNMKRWNHVETTIRLEMNSKRWSFQTPGSGIAVASRL